MSTATYHDWSTSAGSGTTGKHPGGFSDLRNDPRNKDTDSGGWVSGARGITQVRVRATPTKRERSLARRLAGHASNPPMADGSQPNATKPRGIKPGSLSGRKH